MPGPIATKSEQKVIGALGGLESDHARKVWEKLNQAMPKIDGIGLAERFPDPRDRKLILLGVYLADTLRGSGVGSVTDVGASGAECRRRPGEAEALKLMKANEYLLDVLPSSDKWTDTQNAEAVLRSIVGLLGSGHPVSTTIETGLATALNRGASCRDTNLRLVSILQSAIYVLAGK